MSADLSAKLLDGLASPVGVARLAGMLPSTARFKSQSRASEWKFFFAKELRGPLDSQSASTRDRQTPQDELAQQTRQIRDACLATGEHVLQDMLSLFETAQPLSAKGQAVVSFLLHAGCKLLGKEGPKFGKEDMILLMQNTPTYSEQPLTLRQLLFDQVPPRWKVLGIEILLELTFPEALVACSALLGRLCSSEVCDKQGYIDVMSALKIALEHQPKDLVFPVADAIVRVHEDHVEFLEHLMSFWPPACMVLLNYYRQLVWPAMKERRQRKDLEMATFVEQAFNPDDWDIDGVNLDNLEWEDLSGTPCTPDARAS